MEFRYEYNDQLYLVQLDPQPDGSYRATIGQEQFAVSVQHNPDGMILLHIDQKPLQVYYANNGQQHFVGVKSDVVRHYTLQSATDRVAGRMRSKLVSSGDISAQMPGQVIELLVAEGDAVSHGQTLMILEAMKMEIRVVAPLDGVVATLTVSQGATVERGQLLAKIKPAEI